MRDNGIAEKQTYIAIMRKVGGVWTTVKRIPNKLKRSKHEDKDYPVVVIDPDRAKFNG